MNLADVKGLGPKTLEKLNKKEIYSIKNLIEFFPISYQYYNENETKNDKVAIKGTITSNLSQYSPRRNLTVTNFTIQTNDENYKVVAWNQKFLKFSFNEGDYVEIFGKLDDFKKQITLSRISKAEMNLDENQDLKIIPIYSKVTGLNSRHINTYVNNTLELFKGEIDNYDLYNKIHNPKNITELNEAREALKELEFEAYYKQMMYMKQTDFKNEAYRQSVDYNVIKEFIASLDFELTSAQQKVIAQVLSQLESDHLLKGLVLGDVGSGKTIVSLIIALATMTNGKQVAFMAPTELLAYQIYNAVLKFLPDIKVDLMVGATKKSDKRRIKSYLQVGTTKMVVGTHSLIEDDVIFKDLGLVIIDEQHRFGVDQRNRLVNKGENTNYLSLSATPIPRTLAQTLFGIFDVYKLDQKPSDRLEIITELIGPNRRAWMMEMVEKEMDKGNQVFFICPLVEPSEQLNLADVETVYKSFKKRYQDKYQIQMLHGAMKSQDKEIIMHEFKEHKYDMLIATTVIEVGIDIPKATSIVILNAEHFGVATLHQLRGRVGRNNLQSYCYLYTQSQVHESLQRLKLLEEHTSGEILAQKDMINRGQGDFSGIRQSGNPDFKLFDFENDLAIAERVISKYNS